MDLADRVLGPGPNPVPNQVQAFGLLPLFCGTRYQPRQLSRNTTACNFLRLPLSLFVQYFDQSALQVNSPNNVGWRIAWLPRKIACLENWNLPERVSAACYPVDER
jgi:hypothetical protein